MEQKVNTKKKIILKNYAPFTSCILKIHIALNNNAKGLDIVMPMHSLIEYSKIYSKISGSLWNYYRDEPSDPITHLELSLSTPNDNDKKEIEITVTLKYLNDFWRTFKKNFMASFFYGWGSTTSRLEPLRWGSLLFTTKKPLIN